MINVNNMIGMGKSDCSFNSPRPICEDKNLRKKIRQAGNLSSYIDYAAVAVLCAAAAFLGTFRNIPVITARMVTRNGKKVQGMNFSGLICRAPAMKTPETLHGTIALTAAPASFRIRVRNLRLSPSLSKDLRKY